MGMLKTTHIFLWEPDSMIQNSIKSWLRWGRLLGMSPSRISNLRPSISEKVLCCKISKCLVKPWAPGSLEDSFINLLNLNKLYLSLMIVPLITVSNFSLGSAKSNASQAKVSTSSQSNPLSLTLKDNFRVWFLHLKLKNTHTSKISPTITFSIRKKHVLNSHAVFCVMIPQGPVSKHQLQMLFAYLAFISVLHVTIDHLARNAQIPDYRA